MRSYVAVFLAGQSGNQLFQLVAAEFIKDAALNPDSRIMVLEPQDKRDAIWTYEHQRLSMNTLESRSCSFLLSRSLEKRKSVFLRLFLFLARSFVAMSLWVKLGSFPQVLASTDICTAPSIRNKNRERSVVLIGYFQDYYWASSDEKMRQKIHYYLRDINPDGIINSSINSQDHVVIHVRRADYMNETSLGALGANYYRLAIEQVRSHYPEVKRIIVLTDDASLDESFLSETPFEIEVIGPDKASAATAFEIMRQSRNLVIANSSFSWWAAYLNYNKTTLVVYPRPWFRKLKAFHNNPPTWIALESEWVQNQDKLW